MKIFVLGGDGFCGWPTSLHLSDAGHDVVILDNLSRRQIDVLLEVDSLTPVAPISARLETWHKLTGKTIGFEMIDLVEEYDRLMELLRRHHPDAIVHLAEQRSAPYSMKSSRTKRYTVNNNVNATHNLLCALVESGVDAHVVHLGTMGVYGYGWLGSQPVPEGYLEVRIDAVAEGEEEKRKEILFPANPGSIYHMTKTLDQLMLAYYAKNDHLRSTDLHQGIVWGTQTPLTSLDEKLINRFDYDGDYGTVLNRFLMQAAVHYPLTVHGTGGQKRAFIHITDTVRCIELALLHPPKAGDRPQIFNQVIEVFRVKDLAELIAEQNKVEVQYLSNPRTEMAENELVVDNSKFLSLGLKPTTLSKGLLDEVHNITLKYIHRVDTSRIPALSKWTQSN